MDNKQMPTKQEISEAMKTVNRWGHTAKRKGKPLAVSECQKIYALLKYLRDEADLRIK